MAMNQTNYGLKSKEDTSPYFTFFTLSNIVQKLKQQSYGTIFDTITTRTFQNIQCAFPPVAIIRMFETHVTPLMDTVLNNQQESMTLVELRNSLLPKLMNGEIEV